MTKQIFNEREDRARTECYEMVKFRDRSQLLTFIKRDESRHSFDYDSLYGAHFYGHLIRVEFSRNTVNVKGMNLALLHRAMTDHRIIYIRERPQDIIVEIGDPSVEEISITGKSDHDKKHGKEKDSSSHQANHQQEEL